MLSSWQRAAVQASPPGNILGKRQKQAVYNFCPISEWWNSNSCPSGCKPCVPFASPSLSAFPAGRVQAGAGHVQVPRRTCPAASGGDSGLGQHENCGQTSTCCSLLTRAPGGFARQPCSSRRVQSGLLKLHPPLHVSSLLF